MRCWPILVILACKTKKKLDVNNCNFAQLTLILLLHYFVKCRSRSLGKHVVIRAKFLSDATH